MFENVLIGIDGRQGGRDATALARRLAVPSARFTLVNVYGAGLMPGRGAALLLASECRAAEERLEHERDTLEIDAEVDPCADHSIGRGLRRRAATFGADLITVGSSTRAGLARYAFGDDTAGALDGAPCAVAVAPAGYAESTHRIARIGVGYDGSAADEQALACARQLAALSGASVDICAGDEQLERWGRDCDLLVVGAQDEGPLGRLLHRSSRGHLASRCDCPLVVLPRSVANSEPRPVPTADIPIPAGA